MPTPLYDGIALFGQQVDMTGYIAERAGQRNEYPGIDGVEWLDLGGRGRKTIVKGIITGDNLVDFNLAITQIESFHDGVARELDDINGRVWSNVLMGPLRLAPPGKRPNGSLGFWQPYELELTHLTQL